MNLLRNLFQSDRQIRQDANRPAANRTRYRPYPWGRGSRPGELVICLPRPIFWGFEIYHLGSFMASLVVTRLVLSLR